MRILILKSNQLPQKQKTHRCQIIRIRLHWVNDYWYIWLILKNSFWNTLSESEIELYDSGIAEEYKYSFQTTDALYQ